MQDPDLSDSLAAARQPPCYTGDETVERLYDMVLRLTQELAVAREEVALLRAALTKARIIDEKTLAQMASAEAFASGQLEAHRALVKNVLGDL